MDRAEAITWFETALFNEPSEYRCEVYHMAIAALREQEQREMKIQSLEMSLNVACDALKKFTKAEQEGRIVVLPCKVGETVYMIEADVDGVWVGVKEVQFTSFMLSSFGKTVFLTREEAEQALNRSIDNVV